VSRNTQRTRARLRELSDELAIGAAMRLRTDADEIRPVIEAVVAYLVAEYPSQDLYIPSAVEYPVAAIREDFGAMSVRALCRKYRCDRRTIYRLLDEGEQ
jgi:Mor family transcriptional regulator